MKIIISLLMLLLVSTSSFAEPIFLMDTLEFTTLRHATGKRQYVAKLTEILKKMRIKQDSFDAMNSDQHDIYEMIQLRSRWKPLMAEVEKQCKKKAQESNCEDLEELRLDTFDFIKKNPENYGDAGDSAAVFR